MFKRTLTQWGKIRRSHAPPFSLLVPTRKPATVLRHITNWLCIRAKTVENLSRNWIFLKKYDTFYNLEFWIFFKVSLCKMTLFRMSELLKMLMVAPMRGSSFSDVWHLQGWLEMIFTFSHNVTWCQLIFRLVHFTESSCCRVWQTKWPLFCTHMPTWRLKYILQICRRFFIGIKICTW